MVTTKDIKELNTFLQQWSKDGFPYIDEQTHQQERTTLLYLHSKANNGDEKAAQLWDCMMKTLSAPKTVEFDYKQHVCDIMRKYGGMNDKQISTYQREVFDKIVLDTPSIPFHRFVSSRHYTKLVDKESDSQFQEKAQRITHKLSSAKGQPNETLARVLKDNPPIFCFTEQPMHDGGIETVLIAGKIRPIITLTRGCMEDKNENLIATTIAHELGHFIDAQEVPSGFLSGNRIASECFADAIAYRAALNASYNPQYLINKKLQFAEQITQRKGENHPTAIMHQTRANVLQQISKNEQLNPAILQQKLLQTNSQA